LAVWQAPRIARSARLKGARGLNEGADMPKVDGVLRQDVTRPPAVRRHHLSMPCLVQERIAPRQDGQLRREPGRR
jgi:hypothetical protein